MSASSSGEEKVTWVGYVAFVLTIVFLGLFAKSTEWWRVLDFTVLNGSFGPVNGALTFRGTGGTGRKTVSSLPLSWLPRSFYRSVSSPSPKVWAGCVPHSSL